MLGGLGIDTGIDLEALVDTAEWICGRLRRAPSPRSRVRCWRSGMRSWRLSEEDLDPR